MLGLGDTKSSVLLDSGLQADLRLVTPEQKGAALQYFTGSKGHNIALRDRAIALGLRLNEYGLTRLADGVVVAGASEEDVYAALGLAWVPPELRENRGEVEAAERHALPTLITRQDLRGDLHSHTNATDGKEDLETMARAARAAGLEYLAVTDHSQALAMANGLDERRALEQAARIRALSARLDGIRLLAGIECDIRSDGTLDLADDCLAQLDFVVASVHSGFGLEPAAMTDRLLAAIACPWVDVIGHPTGRLLLRREPLRFDVDAVLTAAAASGVALEINCQVDRLDVGDTVARAARDRGIPLIISSDAHTTGEVRHARMGHRRRTSRVAVARRRPEHAAARGADATAPPPSPTPGGAGFKPAQCQPMSKLLPMLDPFDEIKRIYFSTTKQTIERDMARALELLTHMPTDEARQRVAGFMHGLSDLKREWKPRKKTNARAPKARPGRPKTRA